MIVYSENSVALAKCKQCGLHLDPFFEFQFSLISMQLLLHRLPAYRHVITNRGTNRQKWFRFALVCNLIESLLFVWSQTLQFPVDLMSCLVLVGSTMLQFALFVLGFGFGVRCCCRIDVDWQAIVKACIVSRFPVLLLLVAVAWGYQPADFYWVISLYCFTSSVVCAKAVLPGNASNVSAICVALCAAICSRLVTPL